MWISSAGFSTSLHNQSPPCPSGSCRSAAVLSKYMGLWLAPWRHWQVWGRRGTLLLLSLTCRFPLEQLFWGALQEWLHPFSSHYWWWSVASVTAQDPHYPTEIVPLEPLHWFCICDKGSCFIDYAPTSDNWSMLSMQTGHTKQPLAVDHRLWHCKINCIRKVMAVWMEEGFISSISWILNQKSDRSL